MRVTSLVSVLLSLACACGGATSGSSQPASGCDAEPADNINSGCIALKGADFALSLMRVSDEAQRASGYVPISGSGPRARAFLPTELRQA